VLTKLQKWGDYDNMGEPIRGTRLLPMKTPLSQELVDLWSRGQPLLHMHTVKVNADTVCWYNLCIAHSGVHISPER
jgi:hypothetical protein